MILQPAQQVTLVTSPAALAGPATAVTSLTNSPALIT